MPIFTILQGGTVLDFDGVSITGELLVPGFPLVSGRSTPVFPDLFDPRDGFDAEMTHSITEIR